jgi:hypothetical protein
MTICICICVSKKNKRFLENCVISINGLLIPNKYTTEFIFIVPSNISYLKKFILNRIKSKKIKVNFLTSSRIGIPYARNSFLKFVKQKNYKYLGFLDDDCIINKFWLKNMIQLMNSDNPDIIAGPQLHKIKDQKIQNYFNLIEPNYNHKQAIRWAATNNVFFKKELININQIKFDNKLDNIGGSDQLFFHNLFLKGYKIIWNKRSKVTECFSEERNKINWFLLRNFRYGYSGYYIDSSVNKKFYGILVNICKIILLLILSLFNLVFIIKASKRSISLFYFFRLLGRLYALLGFKLKKYH